MHPAPGIPADKAAQFESCFSLRPLLLAEATVNIRKATPTWTNHLYLSNMQQPIADKQDAAGGVV